MMAWGPIDGVITLSLMILFIGIWVWAWRRRHKTVFDRMAALPMEDDIDTAMTEDEQTGGDND